MTFSQHRNDIVFLVFLASVKYILLQFFRVECFLNSLLLILLSSRNKDHSASQVNIISLENLMNANLNSIIVK